MLVHILTFSLFISGPSGDIVMTQPVLSLAVTAGELAAIYCKSIKSLLHRTEKIYLCWILQRPGQSTHPILLMSPRTSGVPGRFSGRGSETNFMLKISKVGAEEWGFFTEHKV